MEQNNIEEMRQLVKERIISFDNVEYKQIIQLINQKIKITMMIHPISPCSWEQEFSLEELNQWSVLFSYYKTIEAAFEKLNNYSQISVQIQNKIMILTVSLDHIIQQYSFDIQLPQTEMSIDTYMQGYERIRALEKKDNMKKYVSSIIPSLKKFLFPLHNSSQPTFQMGCLFLLFITVVILLNQVHQLNYEVTKYNEMEIRRQEDAQKNWFEIIRLQKLISGIKKEQEQISSQFQEYNNSQDAILYESEFPLMQAWMEVPPDKRVSFNRLYRASVDGFGFNQLYRKCRNKTSVILVIKTSENKRIGVYFDKDIEKYPHWAPDSPIHLFSFSLDSRQTSIMNTRSGNIFESSDDQMKVEFDPRYFEFSDINGDNKLYQGFYNQNLIEGDGSGAFPDKQHFIAIEIEVYQALVH